MTRLKQILLAGTLIPALVLAPVAGALAQDPGAERGGPAKAEGKAARGGDKAEARKAHAGKSGADAGDKAADKGDRPEPKGRKAAKIDKAEKAGADSTETKADSAASKSEGKPGKMSRKSREAEPAKAEPGKADTAASPDRSGRPDKAAAGDAAETGARGKRNGKAADRKTGPRDASDDKTSPAGTAEAPASRTTPATGDAKRDDGKRDDAKRDDGKRDDNARRNDGDGKKQGFGANGFGNNNANDSRDARTNDRNGNDRNGNNDARRDDRRFGNNRDNRGPNGAAVGAAAAAGFAGGFLAATQARRLDDIRRDRREIREGDRVFIREPGRTIVEENGRRFIVHDENERFRQLGYDVRREQRGNQFVDVIERPGGVRIMTYTDPSGRMLRRVRRFPDGREVVLIDNGYRGGIRPYAEDVVVLPPPPLRIPRDRYVVDYRDANEGLIYDTLTAPPLAPPPHRYTLDQIRYSPDVRNYVRSVDINTINFDSGAWDVPAEATGKLQALSGAIKKAVQNNPNAVFLIEGYTDATGNPQDNLSLSDRRAQSVAAILSKDFQVPPENLTTQGYGEQNPKEKTDGPSAVNRRVVVRNVTQLLASSGEAPQSGQ